MPIYYAGLAVLLGAITHVEPRRHCEQDAGATQPRGDPGTRAERLVSAALARVTKH